MITSSPQVFTSLRLSRVAMLKYFCWDLNMATVCYTAELLLPFSLETSHRPDTMGFRSFQALKMEFLKTVKEVRAD